MPPFWKSLLGGGSSSHASSSSSSSAAHGISSSNGSNGKLDAGLSSSLPSSSSNAASRKASSSSLASPSSASSSGTRHHHHKPHHHGSAAAGDLPARASASNAGARQHNSTAGRSSPMVIPGQSAAAGHTPPAPAGIPLSGSAGSRQQHATSLASTSGLSGASSYAETTADDTDDASIPDTPYSTGHSPSHARHKFPQEKSKRNGAGSMNGSPLDSSGSGRDANDESDTFFSDDDAPYNAGGASNGADSRSNVQPSSSGFSKSMDPSSPSPSTSSATGPNAQQSSLKPDIPTTHTILANPLPQPSSGLAAALSSVLPTSSSSSNTSAATSAPTNGKGAAPASGSGGNDAPQGPRTFDIDDMITRLLETGYSGKQAKSVSLKNSEITALCLAAREVFLSQPTLLELSPPVNIVGDVHGQYSDLIRLFEMCSFPPQANYLFLGDYVDRGKQSLETILLLLCYKVKYPENFFLLRGNHECANVTRVYGFYDECKRRCNLKIWKTFVDVFNCLPIAALVAGKIFCVHGGLSPSLSSMDDIRRISRPTDVPDYGLLNDLLWSDPSDTALDWEDNERGVSYCFGKAVIQEFLTKYDFDLICRAHMVVEDGYEFWNDRTLVTIFSAPNYCGEFDNFASSMLVNEDLLCSFELLKPLDGAALKKELAKCRKKNSAGLLPARPAPEK